MPGAYPWRVELWSAPVRRIVKGAASGGVWSTCELSFEMSEKEPEDPEPRGTGREDASLGESMSVCWRG